MRLNVPEDGNEHFNHLTIRWQILPETFSRLIVHKNEGDRMKTGEKDRQKLSSSSPYVHLHSIIWVPKLHTEPKYTMQRDFESTAMMVKEISGRNIRQLKWQMPCSSRFVNFTMRIALYIFILYAAAASH